MSFSEAATAGVEAIKRTQWLNAHGYSGTTVWHYSVRMTNYWPGSKRDWTASGYAVEYAGLLIRDDGSQAEYPSAGVELFCHEDGGMPLDKLIESGRALITFGANSLPIPYYLASYNPRESDGQRDQSINPGVTRTANMHKLTSLPCGDGPLRYYDVRLSPADDVPWYVAAPPD